ncbi:hypothetical protein RP726_05640 [Candidatus Methylospira mobilis]|uniref:hypothetical protein n=1 Tax=Candidatus Methylospira mobilis TaxID=1808979 RepID=UPI0028E54D90|nr:hypothetical protein [Candidatus Methylospira mobilis]WNV05894.1 hypothetical protein RP726_05640 [Candidatus Methylospira mobilis]
MNPLAQVTPEVRLHDGKAVTTSIAVAEYFTKRHDDVLTLRDTELREARESSSPRKL